MRRRKPNLRPDTFPFLAVLLCTMGSLILVLLVLDTRARKAARQRAAQAWLDKERSRQEQQNQEQTAQSQDWQARVQGIEKEKNRLRGRESELRQEQERIRRELETLLQVLRSTRSEIQVRAKDQQTRQERVQQMQATLVSEKERLKRQQNQRTERSLELTKLQGDIRRLEEGLAQARDQRRREQHTWSIVPYIGRRGHNARPFYLEATAQGLIYHPDRQLVANYDLSPESVRLEVQRRTEERRRTSPEDGPYWLILVRPDGIGPFYQALTALRSLDYPYGYEMVEADWLLDFADPKTGPSPLPATPLAARPTRPSATPGVAGGSPATGAQGGPRPLPPSGLAGTGNDNGNATGIPSAPSWQPGSPGGISSPAVGINRGTPGGSAPTEITSAGSGKAGGNAGAQGLAPGGVGLASPLAGGSSPLSTGNSTLANPTTGHAASAGGGQVEGSGARGTSPGQPGGRPSEAFVDPLTTRRDGNAAGTKESSGRSSAPPPPPPGPLPIAEGTGSTGGPGSAQATQKPAAGAAVTNSKPGNRPPLAPPPVPGESSTSEEIGGNGGFSGGVGPGDNALLPPPKKQEPMRPAARPGVEEWIIVVECTGEGVRVSPSRLSLGLNELRQTQGTDQLTRTVSQMLEQRREAILPGDPPFRPVIRFVVQRDGLRAFHLAYPALNALPAEKRSAMSGP